MPIYEEENPLAAGLGFAASYMAGQQQKTKDAQEFEQQKTKTAQDAAYLELAQQKARNEQTATDQQTSTQDEMTAWFADPKNAQPPQTQTHLYRLWFAKAVTKARSLGLTDAAKALTDDYHSGEQAQLYGANAAYVADPKTADLRAHTGLLQSQTQFTAAHAANERTKYQEQEKMVGLKGAQQMELVRRRTSATLAASGQRIAAQLGIAQMNIQAREAIAQSTAINTAQGRTEGEAFQMAMSQYKEQYSSWQRNQTAAAAGKPTTPGFDVNSPAPQPQMPNIQIMNQTPAGQVQPYIVMIGPNGQPQAVPRQGAPVAGAAPHQPKPKVNIQADVNQAIQMLQGGESDESLRSKAVAAGHSLQDINHVLALAHAKMPKAGPNPIQEFLHQHHWLGQ